MDKRDLLRDKQTRKKAADTIGKTMYGANWERIIKGIEELDPNFAEFIVEVPYGSVYPRTNLDLRSREIASITTLTQLNLKPQLKSHIIAGRNAGLSRTEILEIFLHIAMFIGFPLVLDALKVAKEVFDYEDIKFNKN